MALPLLLALAWLAAGTASGQPAPAPGSAPGTPATPTPPSPADAMAEGAALKVGTAARQLAATAEAIARDGRIGRLSVLRADADELARRADLLVRATTPEDDGGDAPRGDAPAGEAPAPP